MARTDEAHDLLDEVLLVDEALALGVVLGAEDLRGLGGVVECGVVLFVLLLRVLGALVGVLRARQGVRGPGAHTARACFFGIPQQRTERSRRTVARFFRLADLGLLDGEAVVGLAVEPGLERILRRTVSDGGKAATWGSFRGRIWATESYDLLLLDFIVGDVKSKLLCSNGSDSSDKFTEFVIQFFDPPQHLVF
jgi:hypothetical protein